MNLPTSTLIKVGASQLAVPIVIGALGTLTVSFHFEPKKGR